MADASTTPPATPEQTADIIFDAVFGRSHTFLIELRYASARRFISRIGNYNTFDAHAVLAALDGIDALIPRARHGARHPHDGKRTYRISVGREGSPVLYLERFEGPGSEALGDDRARLICRRMQEEARADEA